MPDPAHYFQVRSILRLNRKQLAIIAERNNARNAFGTCNLDNLSQHRSPSLCSLFLDDCGELLMPELAFGEREYFRQRVFLLELAARFDELVCPVLAGTRDQR